MPGRPAPRGNRKRRGVYSRHVEHTRVQERERPFGSAPDSPVSKRVIRRSVLRATALGSLAMAARDVLGQARQAPPNIVYIMADDLGYADVACYGRPDVRTPNIDRIAARGVRFLQGYANSAVCSATRTALITGRYQYRLRLGLEEPLGGNNRDIGLPPEH